MKMVKSYKVFILDFDGTICKLEVDWKGLKSTLISHFYPRFNADERLMTMVKTIKASRNNNDIEAMNQVIDSFERPKGTTRFKMLHPELLSGNHLKCIVSNNLTSTILTILEAEGLNSCPIIGIDQVDNPKPSNEAFTLVNKLFPGYHVADFLMIGDTETDREFALNCGIDYLPITEYNEQ